MNRRDLWEYGVRTLKDASFEEADSDVRLLMEYIAGVTHNDLIIDGDLTVDQEKVDRFYEAIDQRLNHVPVQYITGIQCFMGLDFQVTPDVLVPRADTEILVEEVMRLGLDHMDILDMCTGSGCIILSLLNYANECHGTGVDISDRALDVARTNAGRLKLGADFIQSDLFGSLKDELYDVIVSNPPYIRSDVIPTLMPEVREHEPVLALDGDEDGLKFYRIIVQDGYTHLRRGGHIFFEIGYDQGEDVKRLLADGGYSNIEIVKDYAGLDRVVHGVKE